MIGQQFSPALLRYNCFRNAHRGLADSVKLHVLGQKSGGWLSFPLDLSGLVIGEALDEVIHCVRNRHQGRNYHYRSHPAVKSVSLFAHVLLLAIFLLLSRSKPRNLGSSECRPSRCRHKDGRHRFDPGQSHNKRVHRTGSVSRPVIKAQCRVGSRYQPHGRPRIVETVARSRRGSDRRPRAERRVIRRYSYSRSQLVLLDEIGSHRGVGIRRHGVRLRIGIAVPVGKDQAPGSRLILG